MTASPYGYVAPESESELLDAVATAPGPVRILSGGTWLVPLLQSGELQAGTVVDLRDTGLDRIEVDARQLRIGAAVTYAELERDPLVRAHAPLLRAMAGTITGGPQIRHQGTIGGSAAYANPASDVPTALVALDAGLVVGSRARGRRRIPAEQFFLGAFQTALAPDEVLLQIEVDASLGEVRSAYRKLKFGESSWPVVTAAATWVPGGLVLAVGGLLDHPVRLQFEEGATPDITALRYALAASGPALWADELANSTYRIAVAPVIAARAVEAGRKGAA